jgi:hypothetical protein
MARLFTLFCQNIIMKKNTAPKTSKNADLTDSAEDTKKLQRDEAILDLPDVEDIPGQEHVRPPRMKSFADTTASSADEEALDILDDDDSNVSSTEKKLLSRAGSMEYTEDENQLRRARLDSRDDEGDPLNEKSFGEDVSGDDLDVPGAEDDDDNEAIGEEDEENNSYSVPDNDDNEDRD